PEHDGAQHPQSPSPGPVGRRPGPGPWEVVLRDRRGQRAGGAGRDSGTRTRLLIADVVPIGSASTWKIGSFGATAEPRSPGSRFLSMTCLLIKESFSRTGA